jgi:ABC-type multidrug transport system fused ATPase/permease subunit
MVQFVIDGSDHGAGNGRQHGAAESGEQPGQAALIFEPGVRIRLLVVTGVAFLLALAEVAATLLVPLLVASIIGGTANMPRLGPLAQLLAEPGPALVARLTWLIVGVFLVKDVVTAGFRFWLHGFVQNNQASVSTAILARYLHASHQQHIERSLPVVLRRLESAVQQVYSGVVVNTVTLVSEMLTALAMLVALAVTVPAAFLIVAAGVVVLSGLALATLGRASRAAGRASLQATQDTYRIVIRGLGSLKEVRLRGVEWRVLADYREAAGRSARAAQLAAFLQELPRYLLEVLFLLAIGLGVLVASADGGASAAVLGVVVVVAFRLLPSITRAIGAYTAIRIGLPAVAEVAQELAEPAPAPPAPPNAPPSEPMAFTTAITLNAVSYRYEPESPWVLRDVSCVLPRGARIALVGASGVGKTTLGEILTGLLGDYEGDVLIDGALLRGREAGWRSQVALVPQDPYITEGSIRDNITFDPWHPADEKRLGEAIDRAQIRHIIEELPLGLDTVLPERGAGLSGGQRQRLALARALYRRASLLVLDEATSAVDSETEFRIGEAISAIPEDLTVITIAHRLTTVRSMNTVLVLDDGRIAASGSFGEVSRTSAIFARWVELNQLDPTR